MTESIDPHYMKLENLDFEILILNSIELLGCLNHVIIITLWIRYTECYNKVLLCWAYDYSILEGYYDII
jgi:hypothetical protein